MQDLPANIAYCRLCIQLISDRSWMKIQGKRGQEQAWYIDDYSEIAFYRRCSIHTRKWEHLPPRDVANGRKEDRIADSKEGCNKLCFNRNKQSHTSFACPSGPRLSESHIRIHSLHLMNLAHCDCNCHTSQLEAAQQLAMRLMMLGLWVPGLMEMYIWYHYAIFP